MKRKLTLAFVAASISLFAVNVTSQAQESADTVASAIEGLQSDVNLLKKIKFSGYIQAQYQKADTIGSPSVAGGSFAGYDNRFQVRRARLKAAYAGENSTIAVQFDLKDDGSVKVKEAYGIYTEPLLKTFSLTGGFFNRPIGYEVEYSSGLLESPERSRITQTLFPDEVDLGAKLTIQAPKTSPLNFLKLDIGLFNGNAITSETDKFKDVIAHLSFKKAVMNENLLLSGGLSYYSGGWANPSGKVYNYNAADSSFTQDLTLILKGDKVKRDYMGVDAQASFSSALGLTTVRGEYMWGKQAGTGNSSVSPKGAVTNTIKETATVLLDTLTKKYLPVTALVTTPADIMVRDFSGGYVYFIQRLMQTKHELVVKYDWYDPNTKITGAEIVKGKKTGAADLKFTTLGLGWNYYATSNVRFSVYYDMVSNEKANAKFDKAVVAEDAVKNYTKDLKDNVLTVRVLYKF